MDRFARIIAGHPIPTLIAVLAVTLVAAAGIVDPRSGEVRLWLDPAIDRLMPNDEARQYYDDMRRRFGSDDTLTIAVVTDDVFSADVLPRVARMTQRFQEVDARRHFLIGERDDYGDADTNVWGILDASYQELQQAAHDCLSAGERTVGRQVEPREQTPADYAFLVEELSGLLGAYVTRNAALTPFVGNNSPR